MSHGMIGTKNIASLSLKFLERLNRLFVFGTYLPCIWTENRIWDYAESLPREQTFPEQRCGSRLLWNGCFRKAPTHFPNMLMCFMHVFPRNPTGLTAAVGKRNKDQWLVRNIKTGHKFQPESGTSIFPWGEKVTKKIMKLKRRGFSFIYFFFSTKTVVILGTGYIWTRSTQKGKTPNRDLQR